jgi:hypothetical protein
MGCNPRIPGSWLDLYHRVDGSSRLRNRMWWSLLTGQEAGMVLFEQDESTAYGGETRSSHAALNR